MTTTTKTAPVGDFEFVMRQPMIMEAIREYAAKRYNGVVVDMDLRITRSGESRISADVVLASNDMQAAVACAAPVTVVTPPATPSDTPAEVAADSATVEASRPDPQEAVSVSNAEEPVVEETVETAVVEDPAVDAVSEDDDIFG